MQSGPHGLFLLFIVEGLCENVLGHLYCLIFGCQSFCRIRPQVMKECLCGGGNILSAVRERRKTEKGKTHCLSSLYSKYLQLNHVKGSSVYSCKVCVAA